MNARVQIPFQSDIGELLPRQRRFGFTFASAGSALLAAGAAILLFQVETPVFTGFLGDARLGLSFALIIEVAKPLLTFVAWSMVLRSSRIPSPVQFAGLVLLPLILWGISAFAVFASVSRAATHPHLEAVRAADTDAILHEHGARTNMLQGNAKQQLDALADRSKREIARLDACLTDAQKAAAEHEANLRSQLVKELGSAADEPDLDRLKSFRDNDNERVARERQGIRNDFEQDKARAASQRESALAALPRRTLGVFPRDTTAAQAEIEGRYSQKLAQLQRRFEEKDTALKSQLKEAPPVSTSHAAIAGALQGQLLALAARSRDTQASLREELRAQEDRFANERAALLSSLQSALGTANDQFKARMQEVNLRDYETDFRVSNPLVDGTLAAVNAALGVKALSRPQLVTLFTLFVTLAVEGILWLSCVWLSVAVRDHPATIATEFEAAVGQELAAERLRASGCRELLRRMRERTVESIRDFVRSKQTNP